MGVQSQPAEIGWMPTRELIFDENQGRVFVKNSAAGVRPANRKEAVALRPMTNSATVVLLPRPNSAEGAGHRQTGRAGWRLGGAGRRALNEDVHGYHKAR